MSRETNRFAVLTLHRDDETVFLFEYGNDSQGAILHADTAEEIEHGYSATWTSGSGLVLLAGSEKDVRAPYLFNNRTAVDRDV